MYSIDEIKRRVEPVAREFDVASVYLFGSYARGEATPQSDIDLLIDTDIVFSFFKVCGLYAKFRKALGKKVDIITTSPHHVIKVDFIDLISQDLVKIYDRNS